MVPLGQHRARLVGYKSHAKTARSREVGPRGGSDPCREPVTEMMLPAAAVAGAPDVKARITVKHLDRSRDPKMNCILSDNACYGCISSFTEPPG